MSAPKPAMKEWVIHLLETIEQEPDPAVSKHGPTFRRAYESTLSGNVSADDIIQVLTPCIEQIYAECASKYRTRQLVEATVKYIINPKLRLEPKFNK